jgi:glycosyltransferase involved in cell wall biosynthesis
MENDKALFVAFYFWGGYNTQSLWQEFDKIYELADKFAGAEQLVFENKRLLADKEVLSYYKSTEFIPIWATAKGLTANGTDFLQLIDNAYDYGLLPEMFGAQLIHQMAEESVTIDTTKPSLLSIGRLHPQKGFDIAVEAAALLKKQGLNL